MHLSEIFNPRIFTSAEGEFYDDGFVLAAIDRASSSLVIHEWSSRQPGNGNTRRALGWLRDQGYTQITANGVGLIEDGIGDIATAYWQHMLQLGLVDTLLDDEGQDITQAMSHP